jgi:hypothetical protein
VPRIAHAFGQYKIIKKVYEAYDRQGDQYHGFALIGAFSMLHRSLKRSDMPDKESFIEDYNSVNYELDLSQALSFFQSFGLFDLVKVIGFKRFFYGICSYLVKKTWR